jgi:hypothetical protein
MPPQGGSPLTPSVRGEAPHHRAPAAAPLPHGGAASVGSCHSQLFIPVGMLDF